MTVSRVPNVEGGIQPTIVTAKGDLITAVANANPARLGVGSDGQELRADSTSATGLSWADNWAAGKNKIINGDFFVNQRNFSSSTTDGTYGFDRWAGLFSGGTTTYSAQTFTAGTAPVAGYEAKNYARLITTSQSAAGNFASLTQKIEDVRTFAGQTVTFSFWAKASTGTPNIGVAFSQFFGFGGSPSAEVITSPSVKTITSSWARYSFTVAVPSLSGKTVGTNANTSYLAAWIFTSCGTTISALGYPAVGLQNVTVDVWGVQIEAGSTATAFQTATGTIQGELAACQRYYFRTTLAADAVTPFTSAAYSTTAAYGIMNSKVTMRTIPSSVDYSNIRLTDGVNSYTITNLALWSVRTEDALGLLATGASGLTQYRPYILCATTSSGFIGLSAEL